MLQLCGVLELVWWHTGRARLRPRRRSRCRQPAATNTGAAQWDSQMVATLYCTVLQCTILYCIVLHCTVLYSLLLYIWLQCMTENGGRFFGDHEMALVAIFWKREKSCHWRNIWPIVHSRRGSDASATPHQMQLSPLWPLSVVSCVPHNQCPLHLARGPSALKLHTFKLFWQQIYLFEKYLFICEKYFCRINLKIFSQ